MRQEYHSLNRCVTLKEKIVRDLGTIMFCTSCLLCHANYGAYHGAYHTASCRKRGNLQSRLRRLRELRLRHRCFACRRQYAKSHHSRELTFLTATFVAERNELFSKGVVWYGLNDPLPRKEHSFIMHPREWDEMTQVRCLIINSIEFNYSTSLYH